MPPDSGGRKTTRENPYGLAKRRMSVHYRGMAPETYHQLLARNIRAARARRGLGQESVARRMRALGYEAWVRQTVGSTEKPSRRVTAEEILGLSYALETSVSVLMSPSADEEASVVGLGPGSSVPVESVYRSARAALNDGAVRWDGDVPVIARPGDRLGPEWPPDGTRMYMANAATARLVADLQDQVEQLRQRAGD